MITKLFPILLGEYLSLFFISGVRIQTLSIPICIVKIDSLIMEVECVLFIGTLASFFLFSRVSISVIWAC